MPTSSDLNKSFDQLQSQFKDEYSKSLLFSLFPQIQLALKQNNKTRFVDVFNLILQSLFLKPEIQLSRKPTNSDILIWPNHFIHLDYILPVYFQLTKSNIKCEIICERESIFEVLKKKKINAIKINSSIKYRLSIKNLKRTYKILKILIISGQKKFNEINLQGAVSQTLKYFRNHEEYMFLSEQIYKEMRPKFNLIGFELSIVGRPLVYQSFKYKIPSGSIQHGNLNQTLVNGSLINYNYVWDSIAKQLITDKTICVTISGPTKENITPPHLQFNKLDDIKNKSILNNQKICLVTFSGPGNNVTVEGHLKNLQIVSEIISENKDFLFIFKLHAKDKIDFYKTISHLSNAIIHKNADQHIGDFSSYLQIADFGLSGASTTIVEYWQNGKPVISLDALNELKEMYLLNSEMIYNCHSKFQLAEAIKSISTKDEIYNQKETLINQFKNEYEYYQNQNPALTVARHICSVIAN